MNFITNTEVSYRDLQILFSQVASSEGLQILNAQKLGLAWFPRIRTHFGDFRVHVGGSPQLAVTEKWMLLSSSRRRITIDLALPPCLDRGTQIVHRQTSRPSLKSSQRANRSRHPNSDRPFLAT